MTLRVIHCGTGDMGRIALRALIDHPDLELVGHYVWSPEKAGKDSGVLCGIDPVGITATNDWSELFELRADCLLYFGNAIGQEEQSIRDVIPFLERGTNVVSFSAFALAHPQTAPSNLKDPVEAACHKGNSSMFFTGIDPGWATTDLAIASLAAANRVDCVRVLELGYWGQYTAEHACREYFGFGQKPGFEPLLMKDGHLKAMWGPTLEQIAEVLQVEIEDWETIYETDSLDHDVETGFGVVKAGTASMVRFELRAMAGGSPIVVLEHVDAVGRGHNNDWKRPHGSYELSYRIEVEGDPAFHVEMGYITRTNVNQTNGSCSVMPAVNAIPAVCEAPPGLLGPLDVRRFWTRNVRGGNLTAQRAP